MGAGCLHRRLRADPLEWKPCAQANPSHSHACIIMTNLVFFGLFLVTIEELTLIYDISLDCHNNQHIVVIMTNRKNASQKT